MTALSSFGGDRLERYQIATDVQGLHDLKRKAKNDQAEALRPVAEQFEALFLQQILKQSRETKLDDGWLEGGQSDTFRSMHDEQLAQSLSAKGGLGLADTIVKQLTPENPVLTVDQFKEYKKQQQNEGNPTAESLQIPTTTDTLALRDFN